MACEHMHLAFNQKGYIVVEEETAAVWRQTSHCLHVLHSFRICAPRILFPSLLVQRLLIYFSLCISKLYFLLAEKQLAAAEAETRRALVAHQRSRAHPGQDLNGLGKMDTDCNYYRHKLHLIRRIFLSEHTGSDQNPLIDMFA